MIGPNDATGKILFHRPPKPGDHKVALGNGIEVGVDWSGGNRVAFTDELLAEAWPDLIRKVGEAFFVGPYRLRIIRHDPYRMYWLCERQDLA